MALKTHAVLTGDLVRSGVMSPRTLDRVRREVSAAAERLEALGTGVVRGEPDFFRGDAWQMLLAEPRYALHAALSIRSRLIAKGLADTRIAMGFGAVRSVSRKRISLSTGEAFSLSGAALDAMPSRARLVAAFPAAAAEVGGWVDAVARLCDAIAGRWTARQAQIVALAILNPGATQTELAGKLRPAIAQQTLARALAAAGWPGLEAALDRFGSYHWEAPAGRRIQP